MKINWIPWGIDLGTTNSVIALFASKDTEVLTNKYGENLTPSAVLIRPGKAPIVGKRAMQAIATDSKSTHRQFKPHMGSDDQFEFNEIEKKYTATELSSLVLHELAAVRSQKGDHAAVDAVVVTVPAAFSQPQRAATEQAALAAGFKQVELLAEPVAAALAFGSKQNSEHEPFWLVYDLGGGTFDAALLRCRDGLFEFIDHAGDNHLGGLKLNEAIRDEIILPQFETHERDAIIKDKSAMLRFESVAETAKCFVTFEDEYESSEQISGKDYDFIVSAEKVRGLETRIFSRTVDLCRELLARNSLKTTQVEKIVMVGGQTRSRHIRKMLHAGAEDPASGRVVEGLGIQIDTTVDPMTVVAHGAAIYAASQPLNIDYDHSTERHSENVFEINLANIPPSVSSARRLVTGICVDAPEDIILVAQRFDGGVVGWETQIEVLENGAFSVQVPLNMGPNPIIIAAKDVTGQELSSVDINITRSRVDPGELKLSDGIGVVGTDGEVEWFFVKGTTLPAEKELPFRTTEELDVNVDDSAIIIPIVAGAHESGYLNRCLQKMRITSGDVGQTILVGTEIQVILRVDKSQRIVCIAEIERLGIELTISIENSEITDEKFQQTYEETRADFDRLKGLASSNAEVAATILKIEEEQRFEEIDRDANGGTMDESTVGSVMMRALEIRAMMHKHRSDVNTMLLWEAHLEFCNKNMDKADALVKEVGVSDRQWLAKYESLKADYQSMSDKRDFARLEKIAYTELPELFEENSQLVEYTGSGMGERTGSEQIGANSNLGSTVKLG